MKEYNCKSRIVAGQPCEYECIVKADFEPRGCLKYAVWEEWCEMDSNAKVEFCSSLTLPLSF